MQLDEQIESVSCHHSFSLRRTNSPVLGFTTTMSPSLTYPGT